MRKGGYKSIRDLIVYYPYVALAIAAFIFGIFTKKPNILIVYFITLIMGMTIKLIFTRRILDCVIFGRQVQFVFTRSHIRRIALVILAFLIGRVLKEQIWYITFPSIIFIGILIETLIERSFRR